MTGKYTAFGFRFGAVEIRYFSSLDEAKSFLSHASDSGDLFDCGVLTPEGAFYPTNDMIDASTAYRILGVKLSSDSQP
jgi:hypothetical protein